MVLMKQLAQVKQVIRKLSLVPHFVPLLVLTPLLQVLLAEELAQFKVDLFNFQLVINGLPLIANQSVIETLLLDALKEEHQKDQEEIDLKANGLINHNRLPFRLEFFQEMELPTPCQTHMLLLSEKIMAIKMKQELI